jgi:hypothetical protein
MKFAQKRVTQEKLQELLTYDPLTGLFRWKVRRARRNVGDVAGYKSAADGYWRINIAGETNFAHRMVFLYVTGAMPVVEVDHINGDRSDNRFANLRLVEGFHNQQNRRAAQSNSASGLLGVSLHWGKWRAQITSKGKRIYLGCFKTPEEAYSVYLQAKRELHPGAML